MNSERTYTIEISPYVGFWRRFFAYTIDNFIINSLNRLLIALIPSLAVSNYLEVIKAIGFVVYFFLFTVLNKGQTLGKMILGIRVVNDENQVAGTGSIFMREIVGRLLQKELPILYLWLLFNPGKQTIADYFADTYVIYDDFYEVN